MPIYFANKTPIDLTAIELMGVSVKDGDTRIGYFGTGLKYAIATLLRTGHDVRLFRNGEEYQFHSFNVDVRGKQIPRVYMNDKPLGFTTALGRNWEVWQAFRELHSNALDEDGLTVDERPEGEFGTIFRIDGEGIYEAYNAIDQIFLDTTPIVKGKNAAVHPIGPNPRNGFYRNVLALEFAGPTLYTYNVLASLRLTEDRTVLQEGKYRDHITELVQNCTDKNVIRNVVEARQGQWENSFQFWVLNPTSQEFLEVVGELRHSAWINPSAVEVWRRATSSKEDRFLPAQTNAMEEDQLERALALLRVLNVELPRDEITISERLGEGVQGLCYEDKIYLARVALDKGERYIATTLYEEFLHKSEGFVDCSRDLQNFLFDKIGSLAARIQHFERNAS